VYIIR